VEAPSKNKKIKSGEEALITINEDAPPENNPACFLHRETFIKRKIPLNAVLSVEIERINNMKESIENIEHFAKIQS
jgi:sorbitol-specific phosphotransferase system component IIA